jgi:hypothetical protein
MKAEQRKELETNTLADKMGRVMQRVQTGERRSFVFYLGIAAALLVALWFGYRWWYSSRSGNSERWVRFYDGSKPYLRNLADSSPETYAGKAARMQIAWFTYWDAGIKRIKTEPAGSLVAFKEASEKYQELAKDCKGDRIFEPQALLGVAVSQEARAIFTPNTSLEDAKKSYEAVVADYPESVEGKFAEGRLALLKDKNKFAELVNSYKELQGTLDVNPQKFQRQPDFFKEKP